MEEERSCINCDYEELCTHVFAGDDGFCDEWRPDLYMKNKMKEEEIRHE